MALTDAKLRTLKPKHAPYKISDGEGLYILVKPTGSRLWAMAYRYCGKQKTISFGKYPTVSLQDARRARDEAKRHLAAHVDPSVRKKAVRRERAMAANSTFEAVANEWFCLNKSKWVDAYSSRIRSRLDDDVLPDLGKLPIAQITPLEVLDCIRKIEERGAIEMAKRVMQMVSAIFCYGVVTVRCARNITADLKNALRPAKAPKHRTALPARELPEFVRALEKYDGDQITKYALQFLLLTFVRTSEIRFARWDEFDDLEGSQPLWRIPAERMKMRRSHLVPLAPQAVEILKKIRKLSGQSDFLFPADTRTGVMSENTMLFAVCVSSKQLGQLRA